ncbi:hypothetical protein BD779DRAFT_460193 [Infundibulicybe gibba]|nr:hypothetical protein BD779DRAFT_460193 [Infundibulicybe gibba]
MLETLRFMAVNALRRCQKEPLELPVHPSSPARCAVSNLLPEILKEIFLHCLPGKWGSFSSHDAPLLLIKVCRSWRKAALSTPLLWSGLPPLRKEALRDGHLQLLKLYLKNSARAALSIAFELPRDPDSAHFLPLITPYLSQSQYLVLHFDGTPNLEPRFTHSHFSLLKNLELSCNTMTQVSQGQLTIMGLEGIKFPWTQLTQLTIEFHTTIETLMLLRNCNSLETLHLRISSYVEPIEPSVHQR